MLLLLDFGGGHAPALSRRIRTQRVYSEILPYDATIEEVLACAPKGLVLVGDGGDAWAPGAKDIRQELYDAGLPILAIGYGARVAVRHFGGQRVGIALQDQPASITFAETEPFSGIGSCDRFFRLCDAFTLPEGFATALTQGEPCAAYQCPERRLFGMQFAPEANDPDGSRILSGFAALCGCETRWTVETFLDEALRTLPEAVGQGHALIALSGGVDSAVCAALMQRAIGVRLHCIHVDSGLLRKDEGTVIADLCRELAMNLHQVDASARVLQALSGVTDPEQKRQAIEQAVRSVFEEEVRSLGSMHTLILGTIYPDILSGKSVDAQKAAQALGCQRGIAPIQTLFKSEVRALGMALGLPAEMVHRQPFPGSGLATRCIGTVTEEKLAILRAADQILREEVASSGHEKRLWQYFAVLLPGTEPGKVLIALTAVQIGEEDTAMPLRLPYDLLEACASRIRLLCPQVERVLWDMTATPLARVEWQ